jgi:hypothetical protein
VIHNRTQSRVRDLVLKTLFAFILATTLNLTSCESINGILRDAQTIAEDTIDRTATFLEDKISGLDARKSEPIQNADRESESVGQVTFANSSESRAILFPSHDFASIVDTSRYRNVGFDSRVRELPRDIGRNIYSDPNAYLAKLVDYLSGLSDDPFIVAKLIHDWITDNIAYDTTSFFSGNVTAQNVFETVRSKKAVCQGYSELFEYMARTAGFEVSVISGYSRGFGYSPLNAENFGDANHAWNGVWIDGAWYLLDCTWDAGGAVGRTFRKDYSTKYLFLEPERMLFTHFPERNDWQLLKNPQEPNEVAMLPGYRGEWFEYGLPIVGSIGKQNVSNGLSVLRIDTPNHVDLSSQLITTGGIAVSGGSFTQKRDETSELYISPPEPGKYTLRIFAKRGDDAQSEMVLELAIFIDEIDGSVLPSVYSPFVDDRCELIAPIGTRVASGNGVTFEVLLPGYALAYLSDGKNRIDLQHEGSSDVFSREVDIPACDQLILYVTKSESSRSFVGILTFPVQR